MADRKPSKRSPTRSSRARSTSGSRAKAGKPVGAAVLAKRALEGEWPRSVYLSGTDESAKAELLHWWRIRWARERGGEPIIHRASEAGVARVLTDAQGSSLFQPHVLVQVLNAEEWGRSSRNVDAAAAGIAMIPPENLLFLVESGSGEERKSLAPLRAACEVDGRLDGLAPDELLVWGQGHMVHKGIPVEDGVLETVLDAARLETGEFLNELDKLADWAEDGKPITKQAARELLRPLFGGTLPALARAVARRESDEAVDQLLRSLESGESEGTVLFHLQMLFTGAIRMKTGKWGWVRDRDNSGTLARSRSESELVHSLDLLYRVERTWKSGRGDARTLLLRAVAGVA